MPECKKSSATAIYNVKIFPREDPRTPRFTGGGKRMGETWAGEGENGKMLQGKEGKGQGRERKVGMEAPPQNKNYHYTTGIIN